MALPTSIKPHRLICQIVCSNLNKLGKNACRYYSQDTEVDALDSFTTQLLQKKSGRWENIRIKRKLNDNKPVVSVLNSACVFNSVNSDQSDQEAKKVDIRTLDPEKIDALVCEAMEVLDLARLKLYTDQFVGFKICPSALCLQKLLSIYAQSGDRRTIFLLQKLVQEVDPEQAKTNANFLHYLAEATWIKGNVTEALKLFEEVYRDYVFLRRKVKLMLKHLIANVTSEWSEATLVIITKFTETIAQDFDDYFLLACVWQACFTSEWYADQCRAAELFDRHEKLCGQISNRIPFVVNVALKNHQIDVVHRLFELLIKYEMKSHYTYVLQALFSYRYWQNDLRSCAEIVQWALSVNITLPAIQQQQFINLLLNYNNSTNNKKPRRKLKNAEDFQLKF